MLSIKNLTKFYHSNAVLNNFSLEAKEGEIVVLLGSSGVGKSTLLRILSGLEKADRGTIKVKGECLDVKEHKVGMVFQHFNLFEHMNVLRNITFPLEKVKRISASEAETIACLLLHKYDLFDKAYSLIKDLSGGQKQRLAIARTVAMKPAIICLDEPTSALDPLLTNHVAKNINMLAQEGYIVVVASHDTGLITQLDGRICLMNQGKIIEECNSKTLVNSPEQAPLIWRFVQGT